ncbi:MAG: hypothetical protein WA239_19245, partial [Candidatus Sulfotelmatobacter sp.]
KLKIRKALCDQPADREWAKGQNAPSVAENHPFQAWFPAVNRSSPTYNWVKSELQAAEPKEP